MLDTDTKAIHSRNNGCHVNGHAIVNTAEPFEDRGRVNSSKKRYAVFPRTSILVLRVHTSVQCIHTSVQIIVTLVSFLRSSQMKARWKAERISLTKSETQIRLHFLTNCVCSDLHLSVSLKRGLPLCCAAHAK